jgi:hypothetical protein
MATDYDKLVRETLGRIQQIHDEREGMETELVQLEHLVLAASKFVGPLCFQVVKNRLDNLRDRDSIRKVGLSEAVEIVLRNANDPITVSEIRDRLMKGGFDFSEYMSNPLASISTTLKRLYESKSANVHRLVNDQGVATWIIFPATRKKKTEDDIENTLKKALEGPSKKG